MILSVACVAPPSRAGFDDHFVETEIGRYKVPHNGHSRVLIIPVIIDDINTPDMSRWTAFFENKLDAFTFKNYWHVNSLGKFDVETKLIEPVHYKTCPLPPEFKNCKIKRGDASALQPGLKFLKEILDRVREEQGVNFADYDLNGPSGIPDGWVDGVLIMANIDLGVALPISMFKKIKLDNTKIGTVAFAGLGDKEVIPVHEFGHLLGFADLYHENKPGRGVYLSLMGEYDDGLPLIDAHSRMRIGWADVIEIQGAPEVIKLPPAEVSGRMIKIGRENEFYLIENRGPGKFFDKGLKSQGLAVYHVDENKLPDPGAWSFVQTVQNCVNCDEWHPLIMNEQPDGLFQIQFGKSEDANICLFHSGKSMRFDYLAQNTISEELPLFNTNYYSGEPSDITITEIDDKTHAPAITVKVGYE